jgi:hypothetical protein
VLYYNVTLSEFQYAGVDLGVETKAALEFVISAPRSIKISRLLTSRNVKNPYAKALKVILPLHCASVDLAYILENKKNNEEFYDLMTEFEESLTTFTFQAHQTTHAVTHSITNCGIISRSVKPSQRKPRKVQRRDSSETIYLQGDPGKAKGDLKYYGSHLGHATTAMTVCGIRKITEPADSSGTGRIQGSQFAEALSNSTVLLKCAMQGRLQKKLETLSSGRKASIRSWKQHWVVLSGAFLFLFKDKKRMENHEMRLDELEESDREVSLIFVSYVALSKSVSNSTSCMSYHLSPPKQPSTLATVSPL